MLLNFLLYFRNTNSNLLLYNKPKIMYENNNGCQLFVCALSQTVFTIYEIEEEYFCFFWVITNLFRSDGRRPSHFTDGTVR